MGLPVQHQTPHAKHVITNPIRANFFEIFYAYVCFFCLPPNTMAERSRRRWDTSLMSPSPILIGHLGESPAA